MDTKPVEEVVLANGEVVSLDEAQLRAQQSGQSMLLVDGSEIPSPLPIAPPIGWEKQPDLIDQIRSMVQREIGIRDDMEVDDPDEEDDFDMADLDDDFRTPYEVEGLTREEILREFRHRVAERDEQRAPMPPAAPADAPGSEADPASAPSPDPVPAK